MVADSEASIEKLKSNLADDLRVLSILHSDLTASLVRFASSIHVGVAGSGVLTVPAEGLRIAVDAIRDAGIVPSAQLAAYASAAVTTTSTTLPASTTGVKSAPMMPVPSAAKTATGPVAATKAPKGRPGAGDANSSKGGISSNSSSTTSAGGSAGKGKGVNNTADRGRNKGKKDKDEITSTTASTAVPVAKSPAGSTAATPPRTNAWNKVLAGTSSDVKPFPPGLPPASAVADNPSTVVGDNSSETQDSAGNDSLGKSRLTDDVVPPESSDAPAASTA